MKPDSPSARLVRRLPPWAIAAFMFGVATTVWAHERFVKHNLKHPLHYEYFGRWPGKPLGIHPDMFRVGFQVFGIFFAFMFIWFSRGTLVEFVQHTILVRVGGKVQKLLLGVAAFITDRPVRNKYFNTFGEWALIFFMRSPALVLMFSATSDSLVMPSYPLDPSEASFFKYAQVLLAILILTQTALPLCGAMILGTWLYLQKWGWMVSVDAMPVLTVSVLYMTAPWQSHKLAITSTNASQLRWVRLILGLGFFCLGWLKVWNHNLTAGVADNWESVMDDPMIKLFANGTSVQYARENWVMAFGLAEVLTGFLVMCGVFVRLWTTIMIIVFTKLMLGNFGFAEIPHIYPIGACLCVMFSNNHRSEFYKIEDKVEHWRRESKHFRRLLYVGVPAFVIAAAVIFPMLWLFTFYDRSAMYNY
jgi:hypothetical protein